MLVQHAKDEPIPPSRRTELEVPADLEALVMACLEKDRNKRPASARVLASQLAECRDYGGWSAEQSAEWWRRHLPESENDGLPDISETMP